MPVRVSRYLVGSALLVALACARGPSLWPVAGRVVYEDGTPVTSGVVEFAPLGNGPSARGKIGGDGRFVLETGSRRGAIGGDHQIAVVQVTVADDFPDHARKGHRFRLVDPKYRAFSTSGLQRTVEAGNNDFLLEVKASKATDATWGR